MVTLFVGKSNGTKSLVNLVTMTDNIDEKQPKQVTFDVNKLSPGGEPM